MIFDDEEKFKPLSDKEWNEIFTADSVRFSNFVVEIHIRLAFGDAFGVKSQNEFENGYQVIQPVKIQCNGQIGIVLLMRRMGMILRF